MALDSNIVGKISGTGAEVALGGQLVVQPETKVSTFPERVGGVKVYGANDEGDVTGVVRVVSPEVDVDFRQRISQDLLLDEEVFNYTAQNTGKHLFANTTMAGAWTAGQFTTNSGNITTISTGAALSSRAYFPATGTQTLSVDMEVAFTAQPTTNTIIDFGPFVPGAANPFAPVDGVFFRLTSAGLQGIASHNGTETSTGVFPLADGTGVWAYNNNQRYQFICYMGGVEAVFWVNDGSGAVMLGAIPLPAAQSRMILGGAVPWAIRHAIVGGAASGPISALLGAVNVRVGGSNIGTTASTQGNRLYGSYQGLSGGTQGSLANYANNANPTAAVPTNTTAALGAGLGGQFWETDTLAVTTDGIICSYQVPVPTVNVPGRRLVLRGVKVMSHVQTALTGGGYVAQFSLAFGHTNVSLATAEAATTKAPRRIPMGQQSVASAAAALTLLPEVYLDLGDAPVFVNPGEFVAVVKKKVGTAPTAGVIAHLVTMIYGWE